MQLRWFMLLVSSICLEGLGRKYLPAIPSAVFYFLKDVVLVVGVFQLRPSAEVRRTARWLYRGYWAWLLAAVVWTVIELLNPENPSKLLALTGLRAYWLWWLAPMVVASSLAAPQIKRRAIYFLLFLSVGISILGAIQFASPPDAAINLYSTVGGAEVSAAETMVSATGRARVSGTFSFLSGFSTFTILIPTLLLSLGLEAKDRRLRKYALAATMVCASVLPMSGSRASVLIGGTVLVITAWTAGLFFTRIGRRVLVGSIAAVVLATIAFPQALEGIQSRFGAHEETMDRLGSIATVLPPVAISTFEYPMLGLGTGMQQNARISMGVVSQYDAEIAAGRYLVELGPIGYLLVWISNLGLIVALVRASFVLKRGGRRAAAGAALSYAVLTLFASSAFDHIAQALYFLGCGFILAEVREVIVATNAAAREAHAAREPEAQQPVALSR